MSIYDAVSGWFRQRRNKVFRARLEALHKALGRTVSILDVGGVETFWEVVGAMPFAEITIVNLPEAFEKPYWFPGRVVALQRVNGSALDLSAFKGKFDVVVSNSVIEHVGGWEDIGRAAQELRGAAAHGWVQTPAFSFPIEPHFALPFIHWFAPQIQAELLRILPHHGARKLENIGEARREAHGNNLLTVREFSFLFSGADISRERFLGLTKSMVATWGTMAEGA